MNENMDYQKNSEILKALGNPVRLRIMEGLIVHKECSVSSMVNRLDIPHSTVSQHLKLLRNLGIIEQRRKGTRNCYRVSDKRIDRLIKILS